MSTDPERECIDEEELLRRLRDQRVGREHLAFRCPMCGTLQSLARLLSTGVDEETAEHMLGFSCIGRLTRAGDPPVEPYNGVEGKGCNWTLGGLLRVHTLEVRQPDGTTQPCFAIASREEAQDLYVALTERDTPYD